jgi:hypothetical protein
LFSGIAWAAQFIATHGLTYYGLTADAPRAWILGLLISGSLYSIPIGTFVVLRPKRFGFPANFFTTLGSKFRA